MAQNAAHPIAMTSRPDYAWRAHWIWQSQDTAPNRWLRFRKSVHLKTVPARLDALIAVDSKYWLWINGALIVREGGLKRGPNPTDTYFDRVHLTPHLRTGENQIAVLVWYWGIDGSSHISSGQGGLLFQAAAEGVSLLSDATWKIKADARFRHAGTKPTEPGRNVLSEWDIDFDARLGDLTAPGFDDSAWDNAAPLGTPPSAPWGALQERSIPFWRDSAIRAFDNLSHELPAMSTGEKIIGTLPANLQVTPYFEIDSPPGLEVTIQIERDRKTTRYMTRGGIQNFEVPAWGNGHSVTFEFAPGISVLRLGYRETGYDTDLRGHFESGEPKLDRLWQKSWRTAYVCMRDGYMDCPDRERSQWPNDAVSIIDQSFYAFDRRSDDLTRKFFAEFVNWKTADGILWGAVPSGRFKGSCREFPAISLSAIGGAMGSFLLHTGDVEALRPHYSALVRYLTEHFTVDPINLVARRGTWPTEWGAGTSNWYDWGDQENLDTRLLDNLWYYQALKSVLELARLTGETNGAGELADRAARIDGRFDALFWGGDHYRSPEYAGTPDDRGNALAVCFGLAGPSRFPGIRAVLNRCHGASIYLERYPIEALYTMGFPDDALNRLFTRFEREIASRYSTLPEQFGEDSNHGWSGWPLYVAGRWIAGIAPTAPGYVRFEVLPRLGRLNYVKTRVPSVRGDIEVEIRRSEREFRLELKSPPGTVGEVGIPSDVFGRSGIWEIRLNGETLVSPSRPEERSLRFQVESGAWSLVALPER